MPAHVRGDLRRLVESEEFGEELFAAAASHAREQRHADAWGAIHRLEVQTNRAVRQFVERTGAQLSTTNRVAEAVGTLGGTALALLPWQTQLNVVRLGTRRYLPAFQRLASAFEHSSYTAFFDYIVDHELAIISFTERSLRSGRGPLDNVHRLLDNPVPLPDAVP